jgi:hypothetical protein
MPTDATVMEITLIAVADSGIDLRHPLFARFFEAWPERRATFINVDAASRRMTDETLELMYGLAKDEEHWVWPMVAELAHNHDGYARLPWAEHESWIDLTVDVLGELAGESWSAEADAAWRRQAERLKVMIQDARKGWDEAMPGHALGV